jgi:mRNA interferase MazF
VTRRGDVVIVDFPFTDTDEAKVRPAVVIQNDRDNTKLRKTVIVMVTGNLRRNGDPSHVFVDPTDAVGASAGLRFPSLISCNNLFTIEQAGIIRVLGHLSDSLKQKLEKSLKAALGLS